MSNCLIKNVPYNSLFDVNGNTGRNFPHMDCEIPEEPLCYIANQENVLIPILTESGQPILIYCFE